MPYCPTCKKHFDDSKTEDLTACPDCGDTLTADPADSKIIPLVQFVTEEEAKNFIAFLEYSDVNGASYEPDERNLAFNIRGNKKDEKQINQLSAAFRLGMQEMEEEQEEEEELKEADATDMNESDAEDFDESDNEDSTEENSSSDEISDGTSEDEIPVQPAEYVKKMDKYNDVASTGIMLIVIGIIGYAYVVLNLTGVLSILSGVVPVTLNIILFAAAIIYGIISLISSRKLHEEGLKEIALENKIREWLRSNVTKETILDFSVDETLPEELLYQARIEALRNLIIDAMESAKDNVGLVEHISEDYYQFVTESKFYEM